MKEDNTEIILKEIQSFTGMIEMMIDENDGKFKELNKTLEYHNTLLNDLIKNEKYNKQYIKENNEFITKKIEELEDRVKHLQQKPNIADGILFFLVALVGIYCYSKN